MDNHALVVGAGPAGSCLALAGDADVGMHPVAAHLTGAMPHPLPAARHVGLALAILRSRFPLGASRA